MRLERWHFPSRSGDFRFKEGYGDNDSILEVENPLAGEVAILRPYLATLRERKLVDPLAGISLSGKSEIEIAAPVAEAGALLWDQVTRGRGTLTAVAASGGRVVATYTVPDEDPDSTSLVPAGLVSARGPGGEVPGETSPGTAFQRVRAWLADLLGWGGRAPAGGTTTLALPGPADAAPSVDVPVTAVTVTRPYLAGLTRGDCPDTRASEVLQAFSTPEQWATWMAGGWMEVVGHLSGHTYRLAHRKQSVAARQGRVAFDCDDGIPLQAYNWLLPPAEEVLMIKLYLEHGEPWVRNVAGVDGAARHVFPHPMGEFGFVDGLADQRFLQSVGSAARLWFPALAAFRRGGEA